MALFKTIGRSTIAAGFLCGSIAAFAHAQSDAPLKSVLVTDKPTATPAALPTATPNVQRTITSPAPASPAATQQTVWFGDTPVLESNAEALQPQPTPIRSIENNVVSNGGDIVATPIPLTPLPKPKPQSNELILDALGIATAESAAGPRIRGTVAGGIANLVGIRPGDVITNVHGSEIYSKAEFIQELRKAVRTNEVEIPIVGIRTGRPFAVAVSAEQLRQSAREQSNPPSRVQATQMEPQIVRGSNPVVRATPVSPQPTIRPVAVSFNGQSTADVILASDPVLPMIATQQLDASTPTTQQTAVLQSTTQQLPVQPRAQSFPYDKAPATNVPPPEPISVAASTVEAPLSPQAQQPQTQQQIVVRTVQLPNGQIVQVQEVAPQPNRQINRRPFFGPLQQGPLVNRPAGRVLAPVRRFFGR